MLISSNSTIKKLTGLTLIELMLALTLSLFVISLTITIYLSVEHNFRFQAALSNLHENMAIALHILTTDLQMAGYIGCAKFTTDFPLKNASPYEFTPINKITSEKNSVTIRHASVQHGFLIQSMSEFKTLLVHSKSHFLPGDTLLISDCFSADIFQIKEIKNYQGIQKIVTAQPLSKCYNKQAEVSHLEINNYFIDNTGRKNTFGLPIYALYRRDLTQSKKVELVENIINIRGVLDEHNEGVEIGLTFSFFSTFKKQIYRYIALRN